MPFDPVLGLSMTGTQIPTVPPNATKDQQTTIINQIVEVLNNYSRDVVASGIIEIKTDGSYEQVVSSVAHNLGYIPKHEAYLANVTIGVTDTIDGDINYPGSTIQLPTYLLATNIGIGGGGGVPTIEFGIWLDAWADDTNFYIHIINAASLPIDEKINYVLYRNPSTS